MPESVTPPERGADSTIDSTTESAAAWRSVLGVAAGPGAASAPTSFGRMMAAPKTGRPASMALQFELREQTPHTSERWRGPTARTVTRVQPGHGDFRLGVRPLLQNARGSWVRGDLAWSKLSTQAAALNLNREHHRWFCEFVAVYRALRGVYYSRETDWLYLDDFTSPLLWHLLAEGAALGIDLRTSAKDGVVTVGSGASVSLDVRAPAADTALHLSTRLTIDDEPHPCEFAGAIGTHGLYSYRLTPPPVFTLAPTGVPLSHEQRRLLGQPASIEVPAPDVDEFLGEFYPRLRTRMPITSTDASVRLPEIVPPRLVLTIRFAARQSLHLDWHWEYSTGSTVLQVPFADVLTDLRAGGLNGTRGGPAGAPGDDTRDGAHERALTAQVAHILAGEAADAADAADDADRADPAEPSPLRPGGTVIALPPLLSGTLRGIDAAQFAATILPHLRALRGVRVDTVGAEPDYRELTDVPKLTVTTVETDQRDWFDLGVIVTVNGKTVPFSTLFAALSQGRKRLLLIDNSYLSLQQPVFAQLHDLIDDARALPEWETGLRISRYQASLWSDFEDLADEALPAQAWRAAVDGLLELLPANPAGASASALARVPLPVGVLATLRPYQHDGYAWLAFLWKHQLGGVLADDMGLGKTLQTLSLIEHATREPRTAPGNVPEHDAVTGRRPFLVVAPTSVVSNWLTEAARFTPGLRVHAVTATAGRGAALTDAAARSDVIVTSYALFRLDFAAYQELTWAGLILDEAQFVKNSTAKVHACARDLDTPFKLALTGTPMENSLLDLWALFSIVAPGLFPSARRFTEKYLRPIERGESPHVLTRLRRRIRPLMLRRTKELVATELPPKQEQRLSVDLNPRHLKLYDTFLQRERQKLLGLLDDLDKNRFIIFRSLTLLRLLSLDPSLVDEKYAGVPSSKLDALFDQLDDVVEGHRALIFSQFTSFLKKAAARLDAQGIAYCYLDGSTRDRAAVIDSFKTGTAPVFLISLKAGGFGLNLTEADYVFLLDPWWNPQAEAQAVDRTHRIGQTRTVMVYRMVATGTIEEKVMALKERKAQLFNAVIDDDAVFSADLTADDIRGLFDTEAPAHPRE
ncbi:DEAD/DEAH box helicase [Cryobacterium frigoriphilum]|uniref:DEAD/DEAH box helicase n=1 Tax=Cryobacterium frigoriphilum TaxID=1259150 RepID=UPI001F548474|nr:DEAD/DEAH box helicase [Cryobacterium frigoriphilum]